MESARIEASDQIPHPLRVVIMQIPSLPGKKKRQMPGVCPGGGGVDVEPSIWLVHKENVDDMANFIPAVKISQVSGLLRFKWMQVISFQLCNTGTSYQLG